MGQLSAWSVAKTHRMHVHSLMENFKKLEIGRSFHTFFVWRKERYILLIITMELQAWEHSLAILLATLLADHLWQKS